MIAALVGRIRKSLNRARPARVLSAPSTGFDPTTPVALMHIPKTSGTSLAHGLYESLAPAKPLMWAYDRVLFGQFRAFDSLSPELRRLIYLDQVGMPRDLDFIAGHLSHATLLNHYGTFQHVTVLREPRSRLLSHSLFFRCAQERNTRLDRALWNCVARSRIADSDIDRMGDEALQRNINRYIAANHVPAYGN